MHRERGVSCKREGAVGKDSGNNKDLSATLEMTIRGGCSHMGGGFAAFFIG